MLFNEKIDYLIELGMKLNSHFQKDFLTEMRNVPVLNKHKFKETQGFVHKDLTHGLSFEVNSVTDDIITDFDLDVTKLSLLNFKESDFSLHIELPDQEKIKNLEINTLEDVIGTSVNSFEQSQRFTQMNIACVATLANLSTESVMENEYNKVTIFPNPAKTTLTLKSETEDVKEVMIVNSLGQSVKEFSFETTVTVDIKDLNNGVYFVKILGDNVITKKIVVRN